MKNAFLSTVLLCSFFIAKAQTQNDSISDPYKKQNELKLNGVMLLAGAFEVYYERNLNEESSLGISFFIPYDNENLDADLNYYISPYYRIFFGQKYAAGFFLEGFGMLNSFDFENYTTLEGFDPFINNRVVEETETNFALGLGLGGKWLTQSGFVFEISGGIGRNLLKSDRNEDNLVGKFGFNLGYRF